MKKHMMLWSIALLAGTVFGLFMKGIESFTGKEVYVLLLNIDYFPIIKNISFNEFQEFLLHLLVSLAVVYCLYYGMQRYQIRRIVWTCVWLNVLIAIFLYGTTAFSSRTPEITDAWAFMYWLLGHVIYGLLVGFGIRQYRKSSGEES
ncbi:hypothetical protein AB4Y30_17240 [Ornithinibacillus sp. 4-3]|uniref:DUF1440 domain-containing protein n=1 Tax=Ornithinibacillus sp. 4-3 TaxID=3231488 RepID=A0AB39HQB3_9BACI